MRATTLMITLGLLAGLLLTASPRVDAISSEDLQQQQNATNVQVTTDQGSYTVGDTVTVAVTNLGPASVMGRGGLICDSYWPIRLETLGPDGWEMVQLPQDPFCAGVSTLVYAPGGTFTKSFPAGPTEGTYRAVYAYDVPGGVFGSLAPAYSDPFVVGAATSVQSQP